MKPPTDTGLFGEIDARKSFTSDRIEIGKDQWLTPPEIVKSLGEFDLDPCAPIVRPWPTAKEHFTIVDNGLRKIWTGRIWMNPPYGNETGRWMARMADHNNGIALIFARTETNTFFDYIWPKASAILFLKGRISFCHVSGKRGGPAGAPSCLVAYGSSNVGSIVACGLVGKLVFLNNRQ